MNWPTSNAAEPGPSKVAFVAYFAAIAAMVARIAHLDGWSAQSWAVLVLFVATFRADRITRPTGKSLLLGAVFFGILSGAVAYMPDLWFEIAYRLNHAKHYLWNVNHAMAALPWNDGRFLWSHGAEPVSRVMRWIYLTGFDMVVWIPVVRSLVAFDARKMARYALGAHMIQFPLIMPFYTAIRADEVWSVLGDPDRLQRGWTDEVRLDLGANCFPSMHTSVAFAILLLAMREKSLTYRCMIAAYATSIIVSTVYLEVHWLVDVAGGLLLGATAVRIADYLVARVADGGRTTGVERPAVVVASR